MDVFQLMVAIRQIESSNRYNITNSIGALGAYQIMRGNLPSWSREALGRVVSEKEFLANPGIQDQIASFKLGQYYDQFGFDGAASMWFSGQPNPNSKRSDGGNTVQQYVNKVRGVLGMPTLQGTPQKASLTSSKSPGTSSSGNKTTTPKIDRNELAASYGLVAKLLDSVPELKKLFDQAVKEGWDASRFKAKMANTAWWRSHSDQQRQYLIDSIQDPATWQDKWDDETFRINDMAAQMGLTGLSNNSQLLKNLTYGVLYEGWSDAELKFRMADYVNYGPEGTLGGAGGQFQQQMSSLLWANGVKVDQNWFLNWYQGILRGTSTMEQAQRWIRNQAAAMFPGFKDQILAGQNVMDIASPYMQSMANILEINPGTLDLFNPDILGALNYKGKDGAIGAKPLWQWEIDLKQKPDWLKTNNAREGLMGVAHKVAQDMGVMY